MLARRTHARVLAVLLAVAAPLVASCGDDGGGSSSTPTSDCKGATTPATEVLATDLKFDPKVVTVRRGETVRWRFDDGSIPHNVVGKGFRSPTKRGGSCDHTFAATGTFRYVCTLHPQMTGRVVIE